MNRERLTPSEKLPIGFFQKVRNFFVHIFADERREIILSFLTDGPMSARDLHQKLWDAGELMSAPGFFFFMARMEREGLVEGYDLKKWIDDTRVSIRWYRKGEKRV
jgi:hypothetical protein